MRTQYSITVDGESRLLTIERRGNGTYAITVGEEAIELDVQRVKGREYHVLQGDRSLDFVVDGEVPKIAVHHAGSTAVVDLIDERQAARLAALGTGARRAVDGTVPITAPMPGKVVKCLVREGEAVKAGQGIVVVEAMKMENELRTTVDGKVKAIKVAEGDNVESGVCLVLIE